MTTARGGEGRNTKFTWHFSSLSFSVRIELEERKRELFSIKILKRHRISSQIYHITVTVDRLERERESLPNRINRACKF